MSYPNRFKNRQMPDLRLGIKSSFNNIRNTISLLYGIYLACGKKAECSYGIPDGKVQKLNPNLTQWLETYFQEDLSLYHEAYRISDLVNSSKLITSQIEAIQVCLELVFGLAKVVFNSEESNLSERTGGNRYPKRLVFSSNMLILHSIISSFPETTVKEFLFSWLQNRPCPNNPIEYKVREFLTLQSEKCVLKMRFKNSDDLIFQQEGIYTILTSGSPSVEISNDEKVGTFRVLSSFISEDLHTFLSIKNGEIQLKQDKTLDDLRNYLKEISLTLDFSESRILKKNTFETMIYPITNESAELDTEIVPTILYGPPGTGKTFSLQKDYISKFDPVLVEFTTFHQSFSYEEFVEGLKPLLGENEDVIYDIEKGVFYRACEKAAQLAGYNNLDECIADTRENRNRQFAEAVGENRLVLLCIDEINRGNVAAIFGDLISLIEPSKRLGDKDELVLTLPYSKQKFGVPANLLIVGTMNTADRSIQLLDSALRRRFQFKELLPDYDVIKNEKARKILKAINSRVRALINKDSQIGHSYFIDIPQQTNEESTLILKALTSKIIPLLEEYFYNDHSKIRFVLAEGKDTQSPFYIKDESASADFEKYADIANFDETMDFYELNPEIQNGLQDENIAKAFIERWE